MIKVDLVGWRQWKRYRKCRITSVHIIRKKASARTRSVLRQDIQGGRQMHVRYRRQAVKMPEGQERMDTGWKSSSRGSSPIREGRVTKGLTQESTVRNIKN